MSQQSQQPDAEVTDDELLEELRRVGSSLAFRSEVRRILRIISVVAGIALLASVVSVIALISVRSYQQEACDRDNALRKSYTDQWNPVLAESPAPVPPPEGAPKEAVDAYESQLRQREVFIDGITNGFAQHPC